MPELMPLTRKRIGIDCRFAAANAGLGRYTRDLVTALLRRSDDIEYVLFVRSRAEKWQDQIQKVERITADFDHYSFGEQIQFPSLITAQHVDLFFAPHFNVPLRLSVPTVVTIHDLILHRYPNQASFLKRLGYRLVFDRAVRRARRLIAVSKFTRGELEQVYGASVASKTTVILEGVDPIFHEESSEKVSEVKKRFGLEKPYFLYIGNAKEHKNVPMLLEAFSKLDRSEVMLVLVTAGKETEALNLPQRSRLLANVSDTDLPALLTGAKALVTASLYEGFYLPGVEARACGAPIIATNCGAIPEVIGPEAVLVPPMVEALREAMQRTQDLSKSSPPPFSWEKAAAETAALLLDALHERVE